MENQFWAVGRWPGLDCELKGFGPIMSNFFECFFSIFHGQKFIVFNFFLQCSVRTEKLHNTFFIKKF